MAMQMKQTVVLALAGMWAISAWAGEQAVSAEQWLSRKGMTCNMDNTHLLKLSTGVTDGDDLFHYRYDAAKQTLNDKRIA